MREYTSRLAIKEFQEARGRMIIAAEKLRAGNTAAKKQYKSLMRGRHGSLTSSKTDKKRRER